jgi:hypothetical protein
MLKSLANAFHAAVKWLFHIILIPFIALFKGIETLCNHLVTELSKF